MSSKKTTFEQVKLAMEKEKIGTPEYLLKKREALNKWLIWVNDYSSILCASYQFVCEDCGSKDHIAYQCKYNIDPALASYNRDEFKSLVDMKVLEFVLFTGCLELLAFMRKIQKESQELDDTYKQVYPIYSYCYENFIDNALVITARERISTAMEKRNLLQGQKAEVEATPHLNHQITS